MPALIDILKNKNSTESAKNEVASEIMQLARNMDKVIQEKKGEKTMTIDELIGHLTEAKIQGYAGSEPVYIWNDGDWTGITLVDLCDGHIDLNMDIDGKERANDEI